MGWWRGYKGRVEWLWISVVASIVLTVLLNVALRLWPGAGERTAERVDRWARERPAPPGDGGVRVVVPWKAMVVGSLVLTVLLNLVLLLLR